MPSSLNGTGVTFNDGTTLQSGNIPAANLGSGTANSNTFLRGDRTFATPPSQAPTTAQVLSAYAGAAYGAIGTYHAGADGSINNFNTSNVYHAANVNVAGSNLRNIGNNTAGVGENGFGTPNHGSLASPGFAGTWRRLTAARSGTFDRSNISVSFLFLRIA